LQQSYPLAPYLFLILEEALNIITRRTMDKRWYLGHKSIREYRKIDHNIICAQYKLYNCKNKEQFNFQNLTCFITKFGLWDIMPLDQLVYMPYMYIGFQPHGSHNYPANESISTSLQNCWTHLLVLILQQQTWMRFCLTRFKRNDVLDLGSSFSCWL